MATVTRRVQQLMSRLPQDISPTNLEELRRVKGALVELEQKADTLRWVCVCGGGGGLQGWPPLGDSCDVMLFIPIRTLAPLLCTVKEGTSTLLLPQLFPLCQRPTPSSSSSQEHVGGVDGR